MNCYVWGDVFQIKKEQKNIPQISINNYVIGNNSPLNEFI